MSQWSERKLREINLFVSHFCLTGKKVWDVIVINIVVIHQRPGPLRDFFDDMDALLSWHTTRCRGWLEHPPREAALIWIPWLSLHSWPHTPPSPPTHPPTGPGTNFTWPSHGSVVPWLSLSPLCHFLSPLEVHHLPCPYASQNNSLWCQSRKPPSLCYHPPPPYQRNQKDGRKWKKSRHTDDRAHDHHLLSNCFCQHTMR